VNPVAYVRVAILSCIAGLILAHGYAVLLNVDQGVKVAVVAVAVAVLALCVAIWAGYLLAAAVRRAQRPMGKITEVRTVLRTQPVGACIYCGGREKLSEEHVIPFALGGNFVLPYATCGRCAKITSAFERKVLRGFMLDARTVAPFPTRRHKERPKSRALEAKRGITFERIELPVSDFPAFLHLPLLAPASFLAGLPPKTGVEIRGVETIHFGKHPKTATADLGTESIRQTLHDWDVSAYARMLAKIGYGFVVAERGLLPLDEVTVLPLILGKADDASTWLGSADFRLSVEDKSPTHAVGVVARSAQGSHAEDVLVAQVKLFASSGATGYEVVVWHRH
jgi:hypothetical protein